MVPRSLAQRLPIVMAAVLVVLLAALAAVQWHWIGHVSTLERQRMRAGLYDSGTRFAADFDREVTRAFLFFHPDLGRSAEAEPGRLDRAVTQYERWTAEAPYPRLIRDVFLFDPADPEGLQVLWPAERRFVSCPWPPELARLRRRLEAPPGRHLEMLGEVVPEVPALVIPLAVPAPLGEDREGGPPAGARLVVRLSSEAITGEILPALTRQYFGSARGETYAVAVLGGGPAARPLFLSDPSVPAARFRNADVRLPILGLHPHELRALWRERGAGERWQPGEPPPPGPPREPMSILDMLHGGPPERGMEPPRPPRPAPPPPPERAEREEREGRGSPGRGAWTLAVLHRDGSLEDAVAAIRRRNLGISLGILALLAATAGLMVATTQRAQRLARQQIEFVAGVTHELHTPLTAIRSAGQNLADGVVADPAQVRRYGHLIESEGRRLSSMVGQALDFAGIQSGRRVYHPRPTGTAEVVAGALQDCRWLLEEKGIEVEAKVGGDLPPLLADPTAVRQAVANLIENAVKHGGTARWIGVEARRGAGGGVEITVADRGPGIRREDLPHLFEPFFRGREAAAGGVPGSGLGLSLVRHVAEAHGGRVTVASGVGEGSAFTLHLPASPESASPAAAGVEEPA